MVVLGAEEGLDGGRGTVGWMGAADEEDVEGGACGNGVLVGIIRE